MAMDIEDQVREIAKEEAADVADCVEDKIRKELADDIQAVLDGAEAEATAGWYLLQRVVWKLRGVSDDAVR